MVVTVVRRHTACPRLSGLMSRKASVLSLSKSLKQGISPGLGKPKGQLGGLWLVCSYYHWELEELGSMVGGGLALDDLAEDARSHPACHSLRRHNCWKRGVPMSTAVSRCQLERSELTGRLEVRRDSAKYFGERAAAPRAERRDIDWYGYCVESGVMLRCRAMHLGICPSW